MDAEYIYNDVKRMKQKIDVLGLSQNAYDRLYWSGCKTIGKLSQMTVQDLLKIYGIGRKHCAEIVEKAAAIGINIPNMDEQKETRAYKTVANSIYPQNLLGDILGGDNADSQMQLINADRRAGISVALSYLEENSAMFILLRYQQRATYEEIGNYYGLSQYKVQKIIQAGLETLKHPTYRTLIEKGLCAHVDELVTKEIETHVAVRLKEEYLRGYKDGLRDAIQESQHGNYSKD